MTPLIGAMMLMVGAGDALCFEHLLGLLSSQTQIFLLRV